MNKGSGVWVNGLVAVQKLKTNNRRLRDSARVRNEMHLDAICFSPSKRHDWSILTRPCKLCSAEVSLPSTHNLEKRSLDCHIGVTISPAATPFHRYLSIAHGPSLLSVSCMRFRYHDISLLTFAGYSTF
jgi:hypothetical protein